MTARAQAAADTGDRILDATLAAFARMPYEAMRLEEIARDAGVTVQTVIRRFTGKSALVCAMVVRESERIAATRSSSPATDLRVVVAELAAHYERYGRLIAKMYAEAPAIEGLSDIAQHARSAHTAWCAHVLASLAPERADDPLRLAHLVVALDATTWRILRVDQGLSIDDTAAVTRALATVAVT